MSFDFDASDFLNRLNRTEHGAEQAAVRAMEDNTDDLARIAQNIAPIDKATLRRGMQKKVKLSRDRLIGEVSFRAVENGFNNIDEWTLRDEVDVRPSDIMKVVEAVKEWISDFIERRRDELITSIIDDMGEEEYVKVKSKIDGKPFSYKDSYTE